MGIFQLAAGSLFANRFEIECPAGSGGMGSVYRAKDRYTGETVALKLLHSHGGSSDEAERFGREAQILSELCHPGIVSYVAHGRAPDGQRFLAMDWLEGEDLGARLSRGPLAIRDCLRLLNQVADALAVAHQRSIIHRDLKPTNLFLVEQDGGCVKILDFGIARRIGTAQAITRTGTVIGTPEYMSPEQARGSRDLTPASDLFSFGCVLYECLTGQPPFVAEHIAAVLARILFEEPTPLEQLLPGVPAALVGLLGRLLAKSPAQRPADAAALRAELGNLGELPESVLAVTLDIPKPNAERFAEQEQILFSIVLAALTEEESELGSTLPGSVVRLGDPERQALLQALAGLGGIPDFLANGTLVVTVPPLGSAQDQATQAARAALLVKERWPQAMVSMATGRGAVRGRTAVGEVVELAARSLRTGSQPAPGKRMAGVMIDPLSAKLLEGRFTQTPWSQGALLLHEEREVDASRPLLGKPTPCVGREAELGTLESMLTGCIEDSQSRAILITAQPGVGKSRLRHEFLRRVEKRGDSVTVLLGRGELLNKGAAYGMLGRAIRRLCKISGGEPQETQRDRLRERICRYLPAAEQESAFLFLGELCSIPFPAAEYPLLQTARQSPKLLPERLRQAFLSWLAAECAAAPVLFVLDDLHWGDERTVALFNEALRELRGAPLLILALARPEVHTTFPDLWQTHDVPTIALKGLSPRACERLIHQALGKQVSTESLEWMVAQSGGNALYLEELIRAAAEGQLDRKADTVIAMLQGRMGHLEPGPRRTVLAASVFGQILWQGGVARLLSLRDQTSELEGWLRILIQAELLEAHGSSHISGQKEYVFRHALVRDAAYGLLTDGDKRLGHKLAAAFLAAADPQINPAVLGHHFRKAELFEQALQHYLMAGDRASGLSLLEEAHTHYVAADEALRRLPDSVALYRLHVDLLIKLVHSGALSVGGDSHFRLLDEARALLQKLHELGATEDKDRLRTARVDFYSGRIYNYVGQPGRAIHYFQRVLPVAQEFGDQEMLILTAQVFTLSEFAQGQVGKAKEAMKPMLGPVERVLGINPDTIRCLMCPAAVLAANGQVQAARQVVGHVTNLLLPSKQESTTRVAWLMLRIVCSFWAAEWSETMQLAQESIEGVRKTGQTVYVYVLLDYLAWAQSYYGMHAQALNSRAQAAELRRSFGRTFGDDLFQAAEADILLNAGRSQEALAKARSLSAGSKEAGLLMSYSIVERVWGCALWQQEGSRSEAEEHLATSLEICNQTEQVTNAILTELWWGRMLHKGGHQAAAQKHFEQAFKRLEAGGYEKGIAWACRFAQDQA